MNKLKKLSLLSLGLALVAAQSLQANSLSDINGHSYQSAIQDLYEHNIINGYSDGSYKPNQQINRAEFLKIVIGSLKSDVGSDSNCFPDVSDQWFAQYVCYAKKQGIVAGYPDGYFRPERVINYAEAIKIIYETNQDQGSGSGTQWYSKYFDDASAKQISISGVSLSQSMKRGEIAQLIWNYADKKEVELPQVQPSSENNSETDQENTSNTDTTVQSAGKVGVDRDFCSNAQIGFNAIYVSTSGSDSGNGSLESPYKSIHHALQNTSSGSTVVLRGGTYIEPQELRIRAANVTITSMPGEWATIDRSSDSDRPGVYFFVGSDGSSLRCTEVIGGFYVVSTETKWDWGEADRSGASNILIQDNILHGSARDVIKIKPNSDFITIRRNEIYDSGHGLTPGDCNAEGIDNVNGDNTIVQNNHIHNTCSTGVYLKGGAQNGIIEGNLVENTGGAGIIMGFDTSPEYFDLSVNPGYYENINGIVRNNLVINAQWAGIALYASKNALVENNTIVNASGTHHSPIYFGITFQDWEAHAGRPANLNPTIKNNVISQSSNLNAAMIGIRQSDELGGLSGLQGGMNMSGNCYYQAGGQASFEDGRTQVDKGGWTEDWEGNLSEWKSHIGSDSSSLETNPSFDSNNIATGQCAGKGYIN